METTGMGAPFCGFDCEAPEAPGWKPGQSRPPSTVGFPPGRRDGKLRNGTGPCLFSALSRCGGVGDALVELPGALSELGAELRANGWDLALEGVAAGWRDDGLGS